MNRSHYPAHVPNRTTRDNRTLARLVLILCTLHGVLSTSSTSPTQGGSSSTATVAAKGLPRSLAKPHDTWIPPWNPSSRIDAFGFLHGTYMRLPGEWESQVRLRTRHTLHQPCRIRQVPGDGNCLFHSLSLCLCHAVNGTHWNMQSSSISAPPSAASMSSENTPPVSDVFSDVGLDDLYAHSRWLRAQAVACLRNERRHLTLQGREWLPSYDLVESAAQQYGLTADEYCTDMTEESVWGGGPEIVALCNILRRPIHVYELATVEDDGTAPSSSSSVPDSPHYTRLFKGGSTTFALRRMACFGSPKFDRKEALHILSADSRFPDLRPGQQLASGNHFMAVFPLESGNSRPKKRIRGGDTSFAAVDDTDVSLWQRFAAPYVAWWQDLTGNAL